jgi:cell division protein FtsQ
VKQGWRVLAAAVAVVAVLTGGSVLLRRASFFRVRQVQVVGARFLSGAEVAAALDLAPDASLFDPLAGLDRRVTKLAGVRHATVSRRWPGTLVVQVAEAEPVALTSHRGRLALMDEAGIVLPFDPTRAPVDLPVAPADRGVASLLARLREVEPRLFAQVEAASRFAGDVALQSGRRRFLLRADAGHDDLRALAAVARDLARRGRDFGELDGRFTDRVFVRGMTS